MGDQGDEDAGRGCLDAGGGTADGNATIEGGAIGKHVIVDWGSLPPPLQEGKEGSCKH